MLTRWGDLDQTFAALDAFRQRMDRLFSDYNQFAENDEAGYGAATSWSTWPRLTLQDSGNALTLRAEVPGLSEQQLQISLDRDVLTISGERASDAPKGYAVHRTERGSYRFTRSVALPCAVDGEKTSATVKDGVLTVRLEKAAEARPRQITVKAS